MTAALATSSPERSPSPLSWGQYRYIERDQQRRRRRPTPAKSSQRYPTGTLLLRTEDGWILCWTVSPSAFEASGEVSLCFDDSIMLIRERDDVDNEGVLSILEPHLRRDFVPATCSPEDTDQCDFQGSSHRHLTLNDSSHLLGSGSYFVTSFAEVPLPLLSVSLVRFRDGEKAVPNATASHYHLEQACQKRQLVGCHLLFVENEVTTQLSIPFQGRSVTFRVASVLPIPNKLRTAKTTLHIIMPSTRITILDDETPQESPRDDTNWTPCLTEKDTSSHTSPAADLLIDTIRCIRLMKRSSAANVPRAFVLSGPPGVGKTHAVRLALEASEAQGPTRLVSLQGSELLSRASHPAEAATALRHRFRETARLCHRDHHVGIVFVDECEALLSSDTVAAMFGTLLDTLSTSADSGWRRIVTVAATNRIDAVPAWLRRPGRLDREIPLGPPNAAVRLQIIKSLVQKSTLQHTGASDQALNDSDLIAVSEACVGYVPADLAALVRRAALLAFQGGSQYVTADLLRRAMADVGASALRDAALSAPRTTTWDDIVGDAGGAKAALRRAIEWPRTKKQAYANLGLVPPRGILLHGPPGCAKTTLARAAAGASGIAFFSLSPADVYASSYVGEAEAVVRRAFSLARSAAPCVLFFDEIDSILDCGGGSGHGMGRSAKSAEARVLSTFLNEMDGVDASQEDGVLVLGATNRPSTLDAALLRPGRFDNIIYVPPPDEEGRRALFAMQCCSWTCQASSRDEETDSSSYIDIDFLAREEMSGSMTGAEILGACREAAMRALREALSGGESHVKQVYLEESLRSVKPLLSNKLLLEEYVRFETQRTAN